MEGEEEGWVRKRKRRKKRRGGGDEEDRRRRKKRRAEKNEGVIYQLLYRTLKKIKTLSQN